MKISGEVDLYIKNPMKKQGYIQVAKVKGFDELQMRREVEEIAKKLKLLLLFDGSSGLYTFDANSYYTLPELHTKLKELEDGK